MPNSQVSVPVNGGYIDEITMLLRDLLRQVIQAREPHVAPLLDDPQMAAAFSADFIEPALQVIGIWLQLLNIADENGAMRARRRLEAHGGEDQIRGSLSNALARVAASGVSAETLAATLAHMDMRPTLTAHPTEAKRVSVLEIHRRIYLRLYDLESPRWTPRERQAIIRALKDDIDLLWLTGEVRPEKPTVEQEISWGLHFFRSVLFDCSPHIGDLLGAALLRHFPEKAISAQPPLHFSSWIGGDRDGNPFVTASTTLFALEQNRNAALEWLEKKLLELARIITISGAEIRLSPEFHEHHALALAASGAAPALVKRNPDEPFRQYFSALRLRVAALHSPNGAVAYSSVTELAEDIEIAERALGAIGCAALACDLVRPLGWELQIFGFRTVSLDLRQNSTVVNRVLQELYVRLAPEAREPPPAPESPAWRNWMVQQLERAMPWVPHFKSLSDEARELLALMGVIQQALDGPDPQSIGVFILSMTRSVSDLLAVYLIAKYAGLFSDADGREASRLTVVPLFETIEDLRRAPDIMAELLAIPLVRRTIEAQGGVQEIMLGYSDSNKDGGFFCASFELFEAQRRLVQVGHAQGIAISFFHGRGGSVSRGGAPTGRAIAAQPEGTVNGRLRVTEQGEVVSSKFANKGTALYQLEVLTASVLVHTLKSHGDPAQRQNPEHQGAVERIAARSFAAYRTLADDPGLLGYFQAASPVEELAFLKIGSRPTRRFGARGIDDLRAIPWVFAWSQNRHLVTGWFGLGSALEEMVRDDLPLLRDMFVRSPGFRLAIDETEKSVFLSDMAISELYAELVPERADAERIFALIAAEHARTQETLRLITGAEILGARFPAFYRRFERIRSMTDQANRWQVRLLAEHRREKSVDGRADESVQAPLMLTMNCIASGLGWTG